MRNEPMVEKAMGFGVVVCEALGLSPDKVKAIHIDLSAGDVLIITIDLYGKAADLKAASELIRSHVGRIILNGIDPFTGEESTEEWEFAE